MLQHGLLMLLIRREDRWDPPVETKEWWLRRRTRASSAVGPARELRDDAVHEGDAGRPRTVRFTPQAFDRRQ